MPYVQLPTLLHSTLAMRAEPPSTVHAGAGAVTVSVFKNNQSALLLFAPPFDGNDPIRNYTVAFKLAARSASRPYPILSYPISSHMYIAEYFCE